MFASTLSHPFIASDVGFLVVVVVVVLVVANVVAVSPIRLIGRPLPRVPTTLVRI